MEKTKRQIPGQILVVDDDPASVAFLTEFLKQIGFSEVVTAANGKEALQCVEKSPPRLVLLDYRLPDLDGIEVLRRIKAQHPALPVIMVTAYPNTAGIDRVITQGAYDLVIKPVDLRYLEQAVLMGFAAR